jgi:hypothetical protein
MSSHGTVMGDIIDKSKHMANYTRRHIIYFTMFGFEEL